MRKENSKISMIFFIILLILGAIGYSYAIFYLPFDIPNLVKIIIILLLWVYIIYFCIKFIDMKKYRSIKSAYSLITEGFKDYTIADSSDLRKIYDVCGMENYFGSFASFLENYLVNLRRNKYIDIQNSKQKESEEDDFEQRKETFNRINTFLSQIIEAERIETPYDGVNERERKLLEDIETASEHDRKTEVKSGLSYLASALIEKQVEYSKENRWNNIITKIGVIVTIIGLIVSIIIFIIQQNQSLTRSDVKKDMVEVVDSCIVVDTNGIAGYHIQSTNVSIQE